MNIATEDRHKGWLDRLASRGPDAPCVPDGTRVYAVGDIHGRFDLLDELLVRIARHAGRKGRRNVLVFLGDYIDRGPQSKDVIDCLMKLSWPGWTMTFLRGNHEQAMLDFAGDAGAYRIWRGFGADETLRSYGVTPPRSDDDEALAAAREAFFLACPKSHLRFLNRLCYSRVVGDYMFVHAGVRPGVALRQQTPHDMMWIREEFLSSDQPFGKVVVHGHTPSDRPVRHANRIGIDTRAYASGRLTAIVLEGGMCDFLTAEA